MPKRAAAKKAKRPTKADYVGFRCPSDLKVRLEAAALRAGRSLSTEAQFRIEQSLRDERQAQLFSDLIYGKEAAALLEVLGRAMRDAGAHAAAQSPHKNWLDSPAAFRQATIAVAKVLSAVAPSEVIATPQEATVDLGHAIANGLLSALAHERGQSDFMEPWAAAIRPRLGRLGERLKDFDYTVAAASAALPGDEVPGVLIYDLEKPI